jgi:hypothetical protein
MARKASRKPTKISQHSWRAAQSFCVWSRLPAPFEPDQILDSYRLRWQVALGFKRIKSILGFGPLPQKDPASARAWLHGKLFVSLLTEHLMAAADAFPPGDTCSKEGRSRWREIEFMDREICAVLRPPVSLTRTLAHWNDMAGLLPDSKR